MNILEEITQKTLEDLSRRKKKVSYRDLSSFKGFEKERSSFKKALSGTDEVSIIAEVKKASPSKGIIRPDFDHLDTALRYQDGGASAISVLTDEPFFKGSLVYLSEISEKVDLPLLRKDFLIDPYQVKEARAFGADAALIIVAITEGDQLYELLHACREFGIDALVECYDEDDFRRLNFDQVDILGVNNRDLKNFEVDVHRGISILKQAPPKTILVSESGLSRPEDLKLLNEHQIHSALIGEFFMRQPDPGKAVRKLKDETLRLVENEH